MFRKNNKTLKNKKNYQKHLSLKIKKKTSKNVFTTMI